MSNPILNSGELAARESGTPFTTHANGSAPASRQNQALEAFCRHHGLSGAVEAAKSLAAKSFDLIDSSCELARDFDSSEEWVVVRILVRGSKDQLLEAKSRYTAQWVKSFPWQIREKVRLSYDLG
jgi:hypothetical protein